jgi:sugar O-acyltransferase (sialic acid O-acetyltransferase NeuD family)
MEAHRGAVPQVVANVETAAFTHEELALAVHIDGFPGPRCGISYDWFHDGPQPMPTHPQALLILGDGPFAVEALDIAEAAGIAALGFVNSVQRPAPAARLAGQPVFFVDDIPYRPQECRLVCAIVTTRRRDFIARMLGQGFGFASLIHPFANISKRAAIGEGCIVNAGVVISPNAALGAHTIVNRGGLVGHDVRTGQGCTFGPGSNIAGHVSIGDASFVGQGAVIRERLRIGSHAVVAAGAVVLADVGDGEMVAGVPARVVKSGLTGY